MNIAKAVIIALGLASSMPVVITGASAQQSTKVTLAVPSSASFLAFGYVANDMGFWKEQGLDVEISVVAGTGAMQAAAAGDVEFAISNGPDMIAAVPHGANVIGIAELFDKLNYQLVLSKAIADKSGLTPTNSSVAQRAKLFKGLNIAAGPAGSPADTFLTHLMILGGLDPKKDTTRTVLFNSPAQGETLKAGRIDGFAGGAPFTTVAVRQGIGVNWIDTIRDDVPGMTPFVYSEIVARPDYCQKNADICRKFIAGADKAVAFMKSDRDKSVAIVANHLKGVDTEILGSDFDRLLSIMPDGLKNSPAAWENTRAFDLEVGSITEALKDVKLEGKVYSDAYLK